MQDIKIELAQSLDEAEWNWLVPHAQRDALIVVDQQLDIVEVGKAIALDDTPSVQQWISQQLIYKPNSAQLSEWNGDRTKRFNTLIVQPFVLVQAIAA